LFVETCSDTERFLANHSERFANGSEVKASCL
jgi:hypothetical protein